VVKKFNSFNHLWIMLLVAFILLPFIPLILWSFTKQWPWPLLIPEKWSLDSWHYLFSNSGMAVEALKNSLLVSILTLFGNLIFGVPAAKVLAQSNFKGKSVVFLILLSPLFIPYTVSIMGVHDLAIRLEFLNPYMSVALGHLFVTFPYFLATLWFEFQLIGSKIQEAAKMLGANEWKVFWWIELPLLLPSLFLGSLLVMIISISQYLPTWTMSGGTLLTLPLVIFPFASNGNSSIVSAYSLWFFLPILFLMIIYFILLKINSRKGNTFGKEGRYASKTGKHPL
jgi:putative spermidine/putrescine transport system permease protein